MRNFIYKIIIASVAIIIVFEFTISRKFNQFNEKAEILFTKEGRKSLITSIKTEMNKAIEKENYLSEDERILINKFLLKIKTELKFAEEN